MHHRKEARIVTAAVTILSHRPLGCNWIGVMQKICHSVEYRTTGAVQCNITSESCVCCRFTCDYKAECCTVAIRGPEPPTGARGLLQTATSYKRVLTFGNRKCDHGVHPATDAKKGEEKKEKKSFGVEMSCEQLGSTTEHLRGVIDSLQCF